MSKIRKSLKNCKERAHKKGKASIIADLYKDKKYDLFLKEVTRCMENDLNVTELRFLRAKALRKLERYDEAISDLKIILAKNPNNDHALTELYFLYYYLNMYEEAIDMLPKMYERRCINAYSVAISELIMKKQLGIEMRTKKGDKCDYIKNQIFNYSTNASLEHITREHKVSLGENVNSYFMEGLDIKYLFDLIRNQIKNSKKANMEEILEIHFFSLPSVGMYRNENCNFIKVVVIPNTDHIISMYPTNDVDIEFVSELEFEREKLFKKQKVKTLSQIDKFNKRYRRV